MVSLEGAAGLLGTSEAEVCIACGEREGNSLGGEARVRLNSFRVL